MSDTSRTDAEEVDLFEVISTMPLQNGTRAYVSKYVPSYISRTLERELATERRRVTQLEDALYLSREAHDIAEQELAAMKEAK